MIHDLLAPRRQKKGGIVIVLRMKESEPMLIALRFMELNNLETLEEAVEVLILQSVFAQHVR